MGPIKKILPFFARTAEDVEVDFPTDARDVAVMIELPECPLGGYGDGMERAYPELRAGDTVAHIFIVSLPIGIDRHAVAAEIEIIHHSLQPASDQNGIDAFGIAGLLDIYGHSELKRAVGYRLPEIHALGNAVAVEPEEMLGADFHSGV